MAYKTGKSKPIDELSLDEILKNTIWEYALDEEGIEGQDESWIRPIIDTNDVTDDIFSPIITIKIKDTDIYGCGEYDNDTDSIVGISICVDNEWKSLSDSELPIPIIFISIAKIDGVEHTEFVCNNIEDEEAFKN